MIVWKNWLSVPPAPQTVVLARYDLLGESFVCRTCKNGCCVDRGYGAQALPLWWSEHADQLSILPRPQPEESFP